MKKQSKSLLPPPIIVTQVKDFDLLHEAIIKNKFVINMVAMNNEQVKLNSSSENEYKSITSVLNKNGYQWYSFENKQTRLSK